MEDIKEKDKVSEDIDGRIKKFNKNYLCLVICVGAVCAAAIVLAVYLHVMAGLAAAFAGVVGYTLILRDELKKRLGIAYRRVEGGIACALLKPCGKNKGEQTDSEERYLPSRLMWLDVTELCGREKKQIADSTVKVLHIPASVKKIEADAFVGMISLERIVYGGTEEEWAEAEVLADISELMIECKAKGEINEIL